MALLLLKRFAGGWLVAGAVSCALGTGMPVANAAECTSTSLLIPPFAFDGSATIDANGDYVLFGNAASSEIWRLPIDASGPWRREAINGGPPVLRSQEGQVFDPARQRLLALGFDGTWDENGQFHPGPFEIWELPLEGPRSWRRLAVTGTPPDGRYVPSVVIDAATDTLYLVGGTGEVIFPDYELQPLGDTWAFDLVNSRWSKVETNGPGLPGSFEGQSFFSIEDRAIVVLAAQDSLRDYEEYERVWKLDLDADRTWRRLRNIPADLGLHPVQADPDGSGGLILDTSNEFGMRVDREWRLDVADSGTWSSTILPAEAALPDLGYRFQRVVYDADRDLCVIQFGRVSIPSGPYTFSETAVDVWVRSRTAPSAWSARYRSTAPIDVRWSSPPVYDSNRGHYVSGGRYSTLLCYLESGEPARWTSGPVNGDIPQPREESVTVFDPGGDRMIQFGGELGGVEAGDLWELSFATSPPRWARLVTEGERPTARRAASAMHDPRRNRMILFGGFDGAPSDETWELDLRESRPTWRRLATRGVAPPARFGHSAVHDARRNAMIVFGGAAGTPNAPAYLRDSWSLSLDEGAVWTPIGANGAVPTPRSRHLAAYDPVGDRMLVFGGWGTGGERAEAKQLVFGENPHWDEFLPLGGVPAGISGGSIHYEAETDRLLVLGQTDPANDVVPVFQFDRPGAVPPPYPTEGAPLRLLGVGPNPSKGDVTIAFDLVRPASVVMRVHDVRGRVVRDLGPRDFASGPHALVFDGRDDGGRKLADGVYFARIVVEDQTITGKLVVMD